MARKRFEFVEGSSSKFWEVELQEQNVTTWWGRIGTEGQSKTKDFGSAVKAQAEYEKLIEEKTNKGYEEVEDAPEGIDGPALTALKSKLGVYAREAWKPKVKNGAGSALTASKFSGIPWIPAGENWPECKNCQQPMQLFFQLNLEQLPDDMQGRFGEGLLQLFYCVENDCKGEQEAYFGNETTMLTRIIMPNGNSTTFASSPVKDAFPVKEIVAWTRLPGEYPLLLELSSLGVELEEEEEEAFEQHFSPDDGDKLFGWPHWVQDLEYGTCKICEGTMDLVMQIGSEDNLPYMFGDLGIGHISQCKTHKDQMKFGWACS